MLAPTDYDFGNESNYEFSKGVTCSRDEARKMFVEAYGHMLNYNHEQAIACFMACTELDPNCAMAWWGIAYCVSSNYNWSPGLGSGYDPIQQALKVMDHCSELEQDLIRALSTRHSEEARDAADPTVLNMGNDPELNVAFAEAMAPLYEKYSGNLDVPAIYVEALMNLKAWQLWDKNTATGEITPADDNTLLLVRIMEDAFEASEEAKVILLYATSIVTHWNSPHSRSEPSQQQTYFVHGCQASVTWSTCPHTSTHGLDSGKKPLNATLQLLKRMIATLNLLETNPNSTSFTECTITTSSFGALCSMASMRPL